MYSVPKMLQGSFDFVGKGYSEYLSLSAELSYTVPSGKRAQAVYLRAGNSCDEMVAIVLLRNGVPMRYFPIGAKGTSHVALAVVEDLQSGDTVEVCACAPLSVSGTMIVDMGLVEI